MDDGQPLGEIFKCVLFKKGYFSSFFSVYFWKRWLKKLLIKEINSTLCVWEKKLIYLGAWNEMEMWILV
jgi:hypothetical protein